MASKAQLRLRPTGFLDSISRDPRADSPSAPLAASSQEPPSAAAWKDIISLIPTKQDISEMSASIVSMLSREIHDLKQQIDNVDSWVSAVETSSKVMESRVVALEE